MLIVSWGLGAVASLCSSLMSCQASYFLSLRLFPNAATICMCVCVCVCVCVCACTRTQTHVCVFLSVCLANEQTQ